MKKKKESGKDGWLGEAYKQLLGQGITLILLPISVAATFYLTKHYTAPKPMIQFTSVSPLTRAGTPSSALRTRIIQDRYLGEFIWKEPIVINSKTSMDWLNGSGIWNKECEATFAAVILKFKSSIPTDRYLEWNPYIYDEPYIVTLNPDRKFGDSWETETRYKHLTRYKDRENPDNVMLILNDFSKELETIKNSNSNRTGEVEFKVGVLNPGDSDGVIYRDAVLKTGNDTVKIRAASNVDIKARSFAEIIFSTKSDVMQDTVNDTKVLNSEKVASKNFADMVQKGISIPVEIAVTVSAKKVSEKTIIPSMGTPP